MISENVFCITIVITGLQKRNMKHQSSHCLTFLKFQILFQCRSSLNYFLHAIVVIINHCPCVLYQAISTKDLVKTYKTAVIHSSQNFCFEVIT